MLANADTLNFSVAFGIALRGINWAVSFWEIAANEINMDPITSIMGRYVLVDFNGSFWLDIVQVGNVVERETCFCGYHHFIPIHN